MTYLEYIGYVYGERDKNQRLGQWAFNLLRSVRPDLSEQVRGHGLDPFYQDARLAHFMEFVRENW